MESITQQHIKNGQKDGLNGRYFLETRNIPGSKQSAETYGLDTISLTKLNGFSCEDSFETH
jgi:hypothetical protein